jgi:hypothetical protein
MANTETVSMDLGSVELEGGKFRDEYLTFAGADTIVKGTILARSSATGKLVPFAPAGANGANVPIAVLTYEVTRTAAGDEPIRALVAGEVNRQRLIIDADGNGTNVNAAVVDGLRNYGIVATDVQQIAGVPYIP